MTPTVVEISHYCERIGPGFWAEPFNAWSNLAFLLSAWLAARRLRRSASVAWEHRLLIVLMASVGVGSFLWHTLAAPWAKWADVIPILSFISVFLASFLLRIACWRAWQVALLVIVFHIFNIGLQRSLPADTLDGTVFYLPTLALFFALVVYAQVLHVPAVAWLRYAVGVFVLALLLRSFDRALCGVFPLGTHFFWHILAALTLYLVTASLVARGAPDISH